MRAMPQGCHNGLMSALKDRLRADLTTAIKARDELRSSTLRMVLTSITNAEVAGKEARELSDDDILGVLSTEAKRRREAATAEPTRTDRTDDSRRVSMLLGLLFGLAGMGSSSAAMVPQWKSIRSPSCRPSWWGRVSTTTSRPRPTRSPVSSKTSRRQACHGVSPASIPPPGTLHWRASRPIERLSRIRPWPSRTNA